MHKSITVFSEGYFYASHKTEDCAVYMNYFHSILLLPSYKKSI